MHVAVSRFPRSTSRPWMLVLGLAAMSALLCGAAFAQGANLGLSAVPSALDVDPNSSLNNAIDGDLATEFYNRSGYGFSSQAWYALEWAEPVTFTQMRVMVVGQYPFAMWGFPQDAHTLNIQWLDCDTGRWYDAFNAGSADGRYDAESNTNVFELTLPYGYSITTNKVRMNYGSGGGPVLHLKEWEIYDNPVSGCSISGRVTDATSNVGLVGAKVSTTDGSASTYTAKNGEYHLAVPYPGYYDLVVTRGLYEDATVEGAIVFDYDEAVTGADAVLTRQSSSNIAPFGNAHASTQFAFAWAQLAIDADRTPYGAWTSNWCTYGEGYYIIDWGSNVRISRLAFNSIHAALAGYTVEAWDAVTAGWFAIASGSGSIADHALAEEVMTSQIRLTWTHYDQWNPLAITEFNVFGVQDLGAWIEGFVTDAATGMPIAGATVYTDPATSTVVTDQSGYFKGPAAPGTYDVIARLGNVYPAVTESAVVVGAGQTVQLNLFLTRNPAFDSNIATRATVSALKGQNSVYSAIDGDLATAYDSEWDHGWYLLEWDTPQRFTTVKVTAAGTNPLFGVAAGSWTGTSQDWHGLNVQYWDGERERWYDAFNVGNKAGQVVGDDTLFEMVFPSSDPILTDRVRINFASYGKPNLRIKEIDISDSPVTAATVSGRVVDSTGRGVEGAAIGTGDDLWFYGGYRVHTGKNGVFHYVAPYGGSIALETVMPRYQVAAFNANAVAGADTVVPDIVLDSVPGANLAPLANAYADGKIPVLWETMANDEANADWAVSNWAMRGGSGSYYLDWGRKVVLNRVRFQRIYDGMNTWTLDAWDDHLQAWAAVDQGANPAGLESGAYCECAVPDMLVTSRIRLSYTSWGPLAACGFTEVEAYGVDGEAGFIRGQVRDSVLGIGIPSVTVTLNTGESAVTDIHGNYGILGPAGTCSVTASRGGIVAPTTVNGVVVANGQVTTCDINVTLSGDSAGNLAAFAVPSAMNVEAGSSVANGVDGSRSSEFIAGSGQTWYALSWVRPVALSNVKVYVNGLTPLDSCAGYSQIADAMLNLQYHDAETGRWYDIAYVGNAFGTVLDGSVTLFDLYTQGGLPVTATAIRLNYRSDPNPRMRIQEVCVYNVPLTFTGISGRVVDATNGVALKDVKVATADGLYKTKTGKDGVYYLAVPAGIHDVVVSRPFFIGSGINGVGVAAGTTTAGKDFALARGECDNVSFFANAFASHKMPHAWESMAIDGELEEYVPGWLTNWTAYGEADFILDWGAPVKFQRIWFYPLHTGSIAQLFAWDDAGSSWYHVGDVTLDAPKEITLPSEVVTRSLRLHRLVYGGMNPAGLVDYRVYGEFLTAMSLVDAKTSADGAYVTVGGYVVTAVFGDGFYVESPDRCLGVRVVGASAAPNVGDVVSLTGTMATENGERVINAMTVDITGTSAAIAPLGMNNRNLGGGDYGSNLGVTGGYGPNSLGLLVTTTGKVVGVDGSTLAIDDGSGVTVRVLGAVGSFSVDDYVSVVGVSTVVVDGEARMRAVRPRGEIDIRRL